MVPKDTNHQTDICIVGGGLTGLMMAATLANTPYDITLLDRSDGHRPPQDGRTTTIHAAGQKMLSALGVWQHIDPTPTPVDAIKVATGPAATGLSARRQPAFDLSWDSDNLPLGYVVDNGALFDALMAVLTASHVTHLTGHSVTNMVRINGHAQLHIANNVPDQSGANNPASDRFVTCQLVVGCDGGHSPLRNMAGLRSLPTKTEQTAVVAVMRLEKPHENAAYQRFLRSGPIALMPMDGRLASLVWTVPDAEAERLLALDDEQFSSECSTAFGPYLGFLSVDGARLKWPLRPSFTPKITAPHLLLAGDAAHAIHPLAGQGYNLALADAAVLADAVVAGHARGLPAGHSSILTRYETGRRAEIAAMTAATTALNGLFSSAPSAFGNLASLGMGMLNKTMFKRAFSHIATGGVLAKAALLDGRLPNQR